MKAIFIVNLREMEDGRGLPKVITLNDNKNVQTFLFGENGLTQEEILLIKGPSYIEKITEYPKNEADSKLEIIIIRDDANDEIFKNKTLFNDACVVYHVAAGNQDVNKKTELWKNHENTKSHVVGQHERNIPGNPYNVLNDVFECLENNSDFNFNELISKIEKQICPDKKLEAVLEFLHLCLSDNIQDTFLETLKSAGIDVGHGDEGTIKALFEKVKSPGKDTTKNQELTALREALLEKLGNL
jgi:hypothetical protein